MTVTLNVVQSIGTYRCSSGDRCLAPEEPLDRDVDGQYDRYGIYAGLWHEECWEQFGYADFEFDASYAGESLDEDW